MAKCGGQGRGWFRASRQVGMVRGDELPRVRMSKIVVPVCQYPPSVSRRTTPEGPRFCSTIFISRGFQQTSGLSNLFSHPG